MHVVRDMIQSWATVYKDTKLSNGGQKKTCWEKKNPGGEKPRQEIWVGTMAQALNSPPARTLIS